MNNFFIKTTEDGIINLAIGEAKIVCDLALKNYTISLPEEVDQKFFEYMPPSGLPSFVSILENFYKRKALVANGAKQGILAALYSVKNKGAKTIGLYSPYWGLLKPLIEMIGLECVLIDWGKEVNTDAFLLVSPNNPSGKYLSDTALTSLEEDLKKKNIPLIHDAAYFTPTYIKDFQYRPIGDIQIFSMSKSYGLSSLRVGYCLFNNEEYYKDAVEYIETSTVGVSAVSQKIIENIFIQNLNEPNKYEAFIDESRVQLLAAREALMEVNNEIIDTSTILSSEGIFAWLPVKKKDIIEKAMVRIIDGEAFGKKGWARINLGVGERIIKDAVNRINSI